MPNVDAAELDKFSALASSWWDPEGSSKALHDINPFRLDYVATRLELAGARVLDVGCGGGILSEALGAAGAVVTGIDANPDMIEVANLHRTLSGFAIDYECATAESFAAAHPNHYDAVVCMELLEHVPDPGALITACATMLKPDGRFIVSTINRTPLAYALAVLGAEYVLGLLPRGTHDYDKFIRPAELGRWCRAAGLQLTDLTGMAYNPLTRAVRATAAVAVNYLACADRPD